MKSVQKPANALPRTNPLQDSTAVSSSIKDLRPPVRAAVLLEPTAKCRRSVACATSRATHPPTEDTYLRPPTCLAANEMSEDFWSWQVWFFASCAAASRQSAAVLNGNHSAARAFPSRSRTRFLAAMEVTLRPQRRVGTAAPDSRSMNPTAETQEREERESSERRWEVWRLEPSLGPCWEGIGALEEVVVVEAEEVDTTSLVIPEVAEAVMLDMTFLAIPEEGMTAGLTLPAIRKAIKSDGSQVRCQGAICRMAFKHEEQGSRAGL